MRKYGLDTHAKRLKNDAQRLRQIPDIRYDAKHLSKCIRYKKHRNEDYIS